MVAEPGLFEDRRTLDFASDPEAKFFTAGVSRKPGFRALGYHDNSVVSRFLRYSTSGD